MGRLPAAPAPPPPLPARAAAAAHRMRSAPFAVCSLACGMYAFKIREPLAGHAMLVEEGGVHVTDIAE